MAKVLVTGATGFIAGHVIHQLVEAGHEVTGTARSASKANALNKTLSAYAGHDIRIPIRAADLSRDAGWAEACDGMDFVQHIASPIPANLPKDHDELIIPAHDGALRVLKAAKAAGVKRVVMTSSMAAIAYGWGDARPKLLTEEHWSNSGNMQDNTAYTRSKTIAERAAWAYVNDEGKGLELTTINPAAVLGPVMSGDFSASVEILTQLLSGKLPGTPRVGFGIVDVRDVAAAHVLAMTNPAAAGERFLVCDRFMWFSEVADTLRGQLPPAYEKRLPKGELPGWVLKLMAYVNPAVKQVIPELNRERHVSNEKAKRILGWQPRTAEEAILSGAKSLIAHKAV
ncbi:MAG: aldehyde reductase [Hyphomonas sp.]|uniref:SDR family oxidoreductase n=1 Tax=Hyphomonas sp. TaxID=87 RepID=UPI001817555E|nr:aldehyde reductase [Hyphomonas sp.]MBA3069064.1 aldehyde reductase [Hyphomonas sp.]MBU3922572.1 aldehyde reductase [Alphaproteobacteria bacterium]MBU4061698.1 aldehyde reductase [Alphaproteobacteria bacterium]MBU4163543.1 aldehyde reductase [Alphaproteobacteria bacterium]